MKHVVTAAPRRQRMLVTGFGAFPGAPKNPTAAMLRHLERGRARLDRLGVTLSCVLIPVVFAEIEPALARAVAHHRPDAVLHLGLASRRTRLSVETRAINRASPLHPGADGRGPAHQILARGGPQSLPATYRALPILAAIRRTGLPAVRSIDAGDYVCNATLYRALLAPVAPQVGFLHVPRVRDPTQPRARTRRRKPTIEALVRAAVAAILVMARRPPDRRLAAAGSVPTAPPRGDGPGGRPRR